MFRWLLSRELANVKVGIVLEILFRRVRIFVSEREEPPRSILISS